MPSQTSVGHWPEASHFGVHMDPVIPVMVMFTSPGWQPAGWNGSSKWQVALAGKSAGGREKPGRIETSTAGAAVATAAAENAMRDLNMFACCVVVAMSTSKMNTE